LWKLDGNTLINKAHSSTSNYNWSLKTKRSLVYIENKEKKVLELQIGASSYEYNYAAGKFEFKSEFKLIEEGFVEDNPKQLWKKGKPDGDTEGYFFLGSSEDAEKVLSASTASALEIEGMYLTRYYYQISITEMPEWISVRK
jgi:hypothetical protein